MVLKRVNSLTLEFKEEKMSVAGGSSRDGGTFKDINGTVTDGGSFFGDQMSAGLESEGREEREMKMKPIRILGEK